MWQNRFLPSDKRLNNLLCRYEMIHAKHGNKDCHINNDNIIFWLGNQKGSNSSSWIDPYTGQELENFITSDGLDCCYLFGIRVECTACSSKFPCGICELPQNKLLYLKGLCEDDIQGLYDVQYYVHGLHDGLPHFRGLTKSHIYFNASAQRWHLQSLLDPDSYIITDVKFTDQIPIGTHKWMVATENGLCKMRSGLVTELTFSQCYPEKYTCNSGHCIALR